MNLVLWRHAEAEDGTPDMERALTAHGIAQAKRVAHWLDKHLESDTELWVSPAVRARQTAAALDRPARIEVRIAPDMPLKTVLDALGEAPHDKRHATRVVIGHQPWIGQVAAFLLTGNADPWRVRKAAAWWLVYRERGAEHPWSLKAVMDAELA